MRDDEDTFLRCLVIVVCLMPSVVDIIYTHLGLKYDKINARFNVSLKMPLSFIGLVTNLVIWRLTVFRDCLIFDLYFRPAIISQDCRRLPRLSHGCTTATIIFRQRWPATLSLALRIVGLMPFLVFTVDISAFISIGRYRKYYLRGGRRYSFILF